MDKVTIVFKDSVKPKVLDADDVYTKGEMLCLKHENMVTKYPIINIHCVQHSYDFGLHPKPLLEEKCKSEKSLYCTLHGQRCCNCPPEEAPNV